jgi:alpha-amylase/alpha-mannosidase (GH57 family)
MGFKSLIHKRFFQSPRFLWITLLTVARECLQSLANQGFHCLAHKKSKTLNRYKSMTYNRYWFCSSDRPTDATSCTATKIL